eukprot:6573915-Heterocapsa_arctica.AAC.1
MKYIVKAVNGFQGSEGRADLSGGETGFVSVEGPLVRVTRRIAPGDPDLVISVVEIPVLCQSK